MWSKSVLFLTLTHSVRFIHLDYTATQYYLDFFIQANRKKLVSTRIKETPSLVIEIFKGRRLAVLAFRLLGTLCYLRVHIFTNTFIVCVTYITVAVQRNKKRDGKTVVSSLILFCTETILFKFDPPVSCKYLLVD